MQKLGTSNNDNGYLRKEKYVFYSYHNCRQWRLLWNVFFSFLLFLYGSSFVRLKRWVLILPDIECTKERRTWNGSNWEEPSMERSPKCVEGVPRFILTRRRAIILNINRRAYALWPAQLLKAHILSSLNSLQRREEVIVAIIGEESHPTMGQDSTTRRYERGKL